MPQLELSDPYARTLDLLPNPSRNTIPGGSASAAPHLLGTDKNYGAAIADEVREQFARKRRQQQYLLQRIAAKFNPDNGPRALPRCGCRAGWGMGPDGQPVKRDFVSILVGASGRAVWGGMLRCSSVWCCALCAPRIAVYRGEELETVLGRHLEAARGGFFITLTLRHSFSHRLVQLRDAFRAAWRGMTHDSRYRRLLKRLGYAGYAKGREVTIGDNGWHVHGHMTLLTEGRPDERAAAELEDKLYDLWAHYVELQGLPRPLRFDKTGEKSLGVCVELITSSEVGRYVAKMGLAMELATSLGKAARGKNRTSWQLLNDLAESETPRDVQLWHEWAAGMKGERQLTWSRGKHNLRERYGLAEELTDAEVVELEAGGAEEAARVSTNVFEYFARVPGWSPRILDLTETIGVTAALHFIEQCTNDVEYFHRRELPPWWEAEWCGRKRKRKHE